MKALVTGGGGFLGRSIVEQLIERGDQVTVLGRKDYPFLEEIGVRVISADMRDREAVVKASRGMDTFFHVASMTGIWGKRKDFYEINVGGTEHVIHACKKNAISRLVYTSSPSVVHAGEDLNGVDETTPYPEKHESVYASTKAMAERRVLSEDGKNGLLTVSLRPHLIWGPRDTNLVPRIIERAKSGRLIQVGDGTNRVDIVYVDNAAFAHLLAADRLHESSPVCGQPYFITQGEPVNLWSWISTLLKNLHLPQVKRSISLRTARLLGTGFETVYSLFRLSSEPMMTRFLTSQLAQSHYFSIEKAKKELGYSPKISNEEGLERLIAYYSGR